jgi:adenosine deaminase
MQDNHRRQLWSDALRELPKAHLRLHLEAAVSPVWARRWAAVDPDLPVTWDRARFSRQLRQLAATVGASRTSLRRALHDILVFEAGMGVRWVELTVDPSLHRRLGAPDDVLVEVAEALNWASFRTGVSGVLLVAVGGNLTPLEVGEIVAAGDSCGVVAALVVDGKTVEPASHRALHRAIRHPQARQIGSCAAAGDGVDDGLDAAPRRICWGSLTGLGPELLAKLAEESVGVEAGATSCELLHGIPAPGVALPQLLEAGVAVSINADRPVLLGTTILAEYRRAQADFHFGVAECAALARNSWVTSFAPPQLVAAMLSEVDSWELRWAHKL